MARLTPEPAIHAPPHAIDAALSRLDGVPARRALDEAAAWLGGAAAARFAGVAAGSEADPRPGAADGRLLEAVLARALRSARGAVFTAGDEARILAAFGLAAAAEARGGPPLPAGVGALLAPRGADAGAGAGAGMDAATTAALRGALEGLRVLDPACGGGALLAAAALLASRLGARLRLTGRDVSPLAARAARLRLALLGADADVRAGDALGRAWPACDLVLMNPPFLRHEAMPSAWKDRAVRRSGLSRQADLSAHLVVLALRHAPACALVLPRALGVSRSAGPLREEAARRGAFRLSLRSRAAGSFAASVETSLAVWVAGAGPLPAAEASVPLGALRDEELVALASGRGGRRVRIERGGHGGVASPHAAAGTARASSRREPSRRLGDVCDVRFGMKTGANAFFQLRPLGGGRYRSGALGEVALEAGDVAPLLASLRDALAPEVASPSRVLFRPAEPSPAALAYVEAGRRLGVDRRPTCAARRTWWRVAPGRAAAPVLYPAKVGTRAFAFHNRDGLLEDKKWHALFPRALEPWMLALALSASPLRLAVERGARQLTGAQAIADIDCGVLAAVPFPDPDRLAREEGELRALHEALARDPVTTDLGGMLARPAQRALDLAVGAALGLSGAAVERERRELLARTRERLSRAARVRAAIALG